MKLLQTLGAGLTGAVVLNITHQLLKHNLDNAPRMDLMAEEGLMRITHTDPLEISHKTLESTALAADIVANTLFYAAAVSGKKKSLQFGIAAGLAAGIGAVYLPKYLGLNNAYSDHNMTTKLLTIGLYTLGGLTSGLVRRRFR